MDAIAFTTADGKFIILPFDKIMLIEQDGDALMIKTVSGFKLHVAQNDWTNVKDAIDNNFSIYRGRRRAN